VGRWRSTGEQPPEMRIPEGLRDVIGKRLSRLSPECNRLLSIAAVVGRDFRLDTLHAVANAPEEEVLVHLEEAQRVGVVDTQSGPGGVRFRFAHAFFRQTLYEEMFAPRRARLHQQVGEALEKQYAARLDEHAAEMAEHFAEAIEGECLAKAVKYGELAARRAMAVYAYSEAVKHFEDALQAQEVLDFDDKAKRCDLLLALAEALGDTTRAGRACRLGFLANFRYGANQMDGPVLRHWAELGDRYAPPDSVDRVWANMALADLRSGEGRITEARNFRAAALELARQLDDADAQFYVAFRHFVNADQPQDKALLQLAEEFTVRPRTGVSAYHVAEVLWHGGDVFLSWGRRDRAEELWLEAEAITVQSGDRFILGHLGQYEIHRITLDGDFGKLDETVGRSGALREAAGNVASPWSTAFPALLLSGRAEEALATLPAAGEPGRDESPGLPSQRAVCLAHLNRWTEATTILGDVVHRLELDSGQNETRTLTVLQLLETAVIVGHAPFARVLAGRLAGMSALFVRPTCVARHLGAAFALLGDPDQARRYYAEALELATRVRARPEIALTRLGMAELLLEAAEKGDASPLVAVHPELVEGRTARGSTGRSDSEESSDSMSSPRADEMRREALEHLDFAIAEFREMKMQPSLERALRHKELPSSLPTLGGS